MTHMKRAWPSAVLALVLVLGLAAVDAGTAPAARADGHNTRSLNTQYDEPVSHYDTANIRVHYTTSGEHATTADYAQQVGDTFQDVWSHEVDSLGWTEPADDDGLGGDSRTDVYLRELSTLPSIAHVMTDRHETSSGYELDCDPHRCADVSGYVRIATDLREKVVRYTAAHEFNHLSQMATAHHVGGWMKESTAQWMEGEILPERLPGYRPVDVFAAKPEVPLAQDDHYTLRYASWVWNRWLADRHGPDVVRDAWQEALDADQEALGGYDGALAARGSSVAAEFVDFAAATAAWRNDFPWYGFSEDFRRYFWPEEWDVRREDGVVGAGDAVSVTLDHTAYALYEVDDLATVEVAATADRDIAGGVAIVADRGFGDVTRVTEMFQGGTTTATLDTGADGARLTAVVVNADPTVAQAFDPDDPGPVEYANDDVEVTIEVEGTLPDDSDDGQAPAARDTDDSCPPGQVPDAGFADTGGNTHEHAIDCVVWWEVAAGTSADRYAPQTDVNREQMATFVANLIVESGGDLPDAPRDHFSDDDGTYHERNINRLAEAGVVSGLGQGRYGPKQPVYRDQMATFLVNAFEYRTGESLSASGDYFSDDDGNVHEPRIDRAAEAGFTGGSASGDYQPRRVVRRDQMASFLARALDLLVEADYASPPTRT